LSFKKQKWKKFILVQNELKNKKKISLLDHNIYLKPKYGFSFINKYKFYLYSKQRLKLFYGQLSNKNFNQIYKKVYNKFKINKCYSKNFFFFFSFLEKRLDVILYRTLFLNSIRCSKQLIYHGKVYINGKKITINSYLLKKGDFIEIHSSFHNNLLKNINLYSSKLIVPKYLEINYKTLQFFVISEINCNKNSYNFPFWLNLNKLFILNH
jgi:ribosomal protein S4